jgi:hypothetical protein
MSPKELEEIVKGELASMTKEGIEADVQVLKCLQPGRPNPTHRYNKVI